MIRWLLASAGPGLTRRSFLCPSELEEGQRYRHPGRYRQWLLGRAAAKTLLTRHARAMGSEPPAPGQINLKRTEDGWPRPQTLEGQTLPYSLTISHTGERALCALCPDSEGTIGADLEPVAEKSRPLLEDFYTDDERELILGLAKHRQATEATLYWCIKEAVLKARRVGFKESAKTVQVRSLGRPGAQTWNRARVELRDGTIPDVWWRLAEGETMAMAIARLPAGT
jgi:4'-phosphopantetheinyl transferase